MPNHMHGIVQIGHKDAIPLVASVQPHVDKGSLGAVIQSFKAIVTKRARADLHFEGEFWQRNYYEHLLRNEREFLGASEYILDNPRMWNLDQENPGREKEDTRGIRW
jgi:putative transposase